MRPVRKLKKALKKEDSAKPLLANMMEEEDEVQLGEIPPRVQPSQNSSARQLLLTNVAWKSWIPRLSIGVGLVLGALMILGLVSSCSCCLFGQGVFF
jgi:hypothetical protein